MPGGFRQVNAKEFLPWHPVPFFRLASGSGATACAGMGKASPCFGPNDSVSYAQTISFITRAVPDSRNYTPESASV